MAHGGSGDERNLPSTSRGLGYPGRSRRTSSEEPAENSNPDFVPASGEEATTMTGVKLLETLTREGQWLPAMEITDYLFSMEAHAAARALFIARCLRLYNAMKLLKHVGADLRRSDSEGNTLLHKAVSAELPLRAQLLLQMEKRLLNRSNKQGFTALHLAALLGSGECLRLLLESRANVNALTRLSQSALYFCARSGDATSLKMLLAADRIQLSQRSGKRYNPLHVAAYCRKDECFRILVASGADVSQITLEGESLLHVFARNGNSDLLKVALGANASRLDFKDKKGCSPVYTAAASNKDECLRILLEAGADANVRGPGGAAALHICSFFRYTNCMKHLIQYGADLEALTTDGYSALTLAAEYNNVECVRLLCDTNMNLNLKGRDGRACLHLCAALGFIECASALINGGADINTKDNDLRTPLHIAAAYGGGYWTVDDPMLRILAEAGVLLDEQDTFRDTALHIAIRQNNIGAVVVLMEHGANKMVADNMGRTAPHLALQMGSREICEVLEPERYSQAHTLEEDSDSEDDEFYW